MNFALSDLRIAAPAGVGGSECPAAAPQIPGDSRVKG